MITEPTSCYTVAPPPSATTRVPSRESTYPSLSHQVTKGIDNASYGQMGAGAPVRETF